MAYKCIGFKWLAGSHLRIVYQKDEKDAAVSCYMFASPCEFGAAWKKQSDTGNSYLSVKLDEGEPASIRKCLRRCAFHKKQTSSARPAAAELTPTQAVKACRHQIGAYAGAGLRRFAQLVGL